MGHLDLFSFFRLFNTDIIHLIVNKNCRWLDSNRESLGSEATALPTEPQPLLSLTLIINRLYFQSTSVLAHKLESNRQLILPTTDNEAVMSAMASDEPLGQQFEDLFAEMSQHFEPTSGLLSSHRGWKGGLHIQSCGHHMHYDCRQSYCETLKQLMRVTREQVSLSSHLFRTP